MEEETRRKGQTLPSRGQLGTWMRAGEGRVPEVAEVKTERGDWACAGGTWADHSSQDRDRPAGLSLWALGLVP